MQFKTFHCSCCNSDFSRVVAEAVLSAACPLCGRVAKLVRIGMALGLTFNQAAGLVLAGLLLYKISRG